MAYASITYTSASGTTFALTNSNGDPIEYLRQADIYVYVNNVLKTLTTDYTFNTAGTAIILNTAVSGATVSIERTTAIGDPTVVYTAGSTLTAQDLNNADNQIRYGLQEFTDYVFETVEDELQQLQALDALKVFRTGDTMTGTLSMGNQRLTDLPTPSLDSDAVPLSYVNTAVSNSQIAGTTRWVKTVATAGATVSGTDDNGNTLVYIAQREQVYLNGACLSRGSDYTATTGTSIVFTESLLVGDVVQVFSLNNIAVGGNAVDVTFTPSGTGAVPRTVASKLKEVVSVKDFGAVGDGVSDNYTAFQACATYAANLSNSTKQVVQVYVPSGDYLLSQQVIFNVGTNTGAPLGISLRGDSLHSSRLIATTANTTGCIKFTSTGNTELWHVSNLAFLSPLAFDAATNNGTALYIESTLTTGDAGFGVQNNHTVVVENVFIGPYVAGGNVVGINGNIVNNFYRGIDIRNKWFPKFSNIFMTGGPKTQLEASMTGRDSAIYTQTCYSPFFNSVYIDGSYKVGLNLNMTGNMEDFRIDGCTIVGPIKGIYIYHPDDTLGQFIYEPGGLVTNCHLNCQQYCLHVQLHRQINIADNFTYLPQIGTNVVDFTGRPAVFWFDGVGDIIVANNQFLESSLTAPTSEDITQCGIKISRRAEGVFITDNYFNSRGTGIYIESDANYANTKGEVIVSNSAFEGMGSWTLDYKITDKTNGGLSVSSDWWDNDPLGIATKTFTTNFAPTNGSPINDEIIANRADYATKSDGQIYNNRIYGKLSDGTIQGVTEAFEWVNNSVSNPVLNQDIFHIARNTANTANVITRLHRISCPQADNETSMSLVFKPTGGVRTSIKKVFVGPADSAGTGYRYLRVLN
jgi:hypothetical protein